MITLAIIVIIVIIVVILIIVVMIIVVLMAFVSVGGGSFPSPPLTVEIDGELSGTYYH